MRPELKDRVAERIRRDYPREQAGRLLQALELIEAEEVVVDAR